MCGPWRKAPEMGTAKALFHRSLVTPERVLNEYNEDLILIFEYELQE